MVGAGTWEGGVRESAFAYWPGVIAAGSRSGEIVSSLDLFPTLSTLAGVALPRDRVYDGKDMSDILFKTTGRSQHVVLFLYNQDPNMCKDGGPSAARMGRWKAHWATGPGLGGCSQPTCRKLEYPVDHPLLFDVVADPSEAYPLHGMQNETASPNAGAHLHCATE